MTEVAGSVEKKRGQTTMVDVWTQMRGIENGLRHNVDVFGVWMQHGGQDPNQAMSGLPYLGPLPRPIPPCYPPFCLRPMARSAQEIRQLANAMNEVADAVEFLSRQIRVPEGQKYYISELPGTHWHSQNGGGHGEPHNE